MRKHLVPQESEVGKQPDEAPSSAKRKKTGDDPFTGRGSPAFMSPSEPAIRLLKERYTESFALTLGTEGRVHLFMVKIGLWSLVWTFVFREIPDDNKMQRIETALFEIEKALRVEESEFRDKLDESVMKSKERIKSKASQFKVFTG